jgi:hypothetical protein
LTKWSRREEPWRYYLDTAVHFDCLELKGVVRPVDEGGDEFPPVGPVHVITAIQPGSFPESDENPARMDVLSHELEREGIEFIRAVGSSLDGSYREESRAIFGLDDVQAQQLGRRFGQVAIFAWRGPTWSLLACASDRQTHRTWRWEGLTPDG